MQEFEIKTAVRHRGSNIVKIDCLAFSDDFEISGHNTETAQGLQISFEKTAHKWLNTKYNQIKRVHQLRYLGEVIQVSQLKKTFNAITGYL